MFKYLLTAVLLTLPFSAPTPADTIRVSAAISLKDALTPIAQAYQASTGTEVVFAFGASGQLATQIKTGADVDAFISAANKQIDDLAKDKLIDPATRTVIARNTLVLIAPADSKNPPASFAALADPAITKLAIGDAKSVPAGDYALQVLTNLKIADKLTDRLVYGLNVRQVLTYVEMDEVSAGIVYATDAQQSGNKVKVIATADPKLHQSILYPAAVISASKHPDLAANFLTYLHNDKSQKILAANGFLVDQTATAPTTAAAK